LLSRGGVAGLFGGGWRVL